MDRKVWVYIGGGFGLLAISIYFFITSVSFMSMGRIATSLLSALIGFTLIAAAIQLFRLSAVYKALQSEGGGSES